MAALCIAVSWYFIRWNFANAVSSRLDLQKPETRMLVDWLTELAPSDPQTHFAAAAIYEKTFDQADLTRSLTEYETATGLSPNNYLMWLSLGKARNLDGDQDGARAAYQRALELAPNYASVQWVYGNLLLRQKKTDEAFAMIAKAAPSNADYSRTAASIALQIYDGDVKQVRQVLGDNEVTNAALATALAGVGRFEESFDAWSQISANDKTGKFRRLGEILTGTYLSEKKYRLAAGVTSDLDGEAGDKPVVGEIGNGGFEQGVKLRKAGPFEWQIAEGTEPQIGLAEGQKHSGSYSLFLLFDTFESAAFRSVTKTIAVTPGTAYEFSGYYRSDVRSSAVYKWEVAIAGSGVALASTDQLVPVGDWTQFKVKFTVPADTDGLTIRLAREGCSGPSCPTSGKFSFDDLLIRPL